MNRKHDEADKNAVKFKWQQHKRRLAELRAARMDIEAEISELNKIKLSDIAKEHNIPYNTARALTQFSH